MMRKRADLPIASGGRSPTPPRRQLNMPDPTPNNVFSLTWVLSSLALVGIGYLHCTSHAEMSRLVCVEDLCTFTRSSPGIRSMDEFQFLRESLVKADTAQLDKKGNVVKGPRTNRRYKKGMVQTYTVTWKDAESLVQTTLPITQYNLGRKTPRKKVAQITEYVKKRTDQLDVREGRWFTGIGIVCFVFGALLLVMRVGIGAIFKDPPSRGGASRRKLFK